MNLSRLFLVCCLFGFLSCSTDSEEPISNNSSVDNTDPESDANTDSIDEDEKTDDEQNPVDTQEESIFFSKITYVNTFRNEYTRNVMKFEDNKVVKQESFDSFDVLQSYTTYQYNENGLLSERIDYYSDGSINFTSRFNYDDDSNIILVEHNRSNILPNVIYNVYTYSDNVIENELVDVGGMRLAYSRNFLNNEGFIYKTENGNVAEMTLLDGLPISKTVQYSDKTIQFEHVYLESPLPKGPWKNFWGSFYGKLNNQIVRSLGGIISFEGEVDLSKYVVRAGNTQQEFEFDEDGLPVKIVVINDLVQSVWEIKYQD